MSAVLTESDTPSDQCLACCRRLADWLSPVTRIRMVSSPTWLSAGHGSDCPLKSLAMDGIAGQNDEHQQPIRPVTQPPGQPLDALVYWGTTQARDLLVLLGQAYRDLKPEGRLLLLDRFDVQRSAHHPMGYQLLSSVLAVTARAGFRVIHNETISLSDVAPAGDALPPLRLLVFVRDAVPRWRVTYQESERFTEVCDLFQRAFGHALSEHLWQWKYSGGRGQGALTVSEDQVFGHYGVLTRPILYFGQPERAAQVADVMVDPGARGVLTRRGPFFLAAASMPEVCSGYGSKHLIGFGFPNDRAYRVAERLGLYAEVDRITEVQWSALVSSPARLRTKPLEQFSNERAETLVGILWSAMAADLREAIVGVRDFKWLQYRYMHHPEYRYQVLVVSRGWWRSQHLGVVVIRLHEDQAELMDLVGPISHFPRLIDTARYAAAKAGKPSLFTWATQRLVSCLAHGEPVLKPTDIRIPTSVWTPAPEPEVLRGRWWLMSGDTDFR